VAPLTVIVTVTESGGIAPVLEIVNTQAGSLAPDEVRIRTGGHTSVPPLRMLGRRARYARTVA
jgi:hypothetical protein